MTEADTGRRVEGARVRVVSLSSEAAPDPGAAVPAIDDGRTDGDGLVKLQGLVAGGEYRYELQHETFVLSEESPELITVDHRFPIDLFVEAPMVAVVRFVGDELVEGAIRLTVSGSTRRHATLSALEAIRRTLRSEHPGSLTAAFLPSPDSVPPSTAAVRALLRNTGWHEAEARVVRLDEFTGPDVVRVDPGSAGEDVRLVEVIVLPPPPFAGETEARFRVRVTASDKRLGPRTVRFREKLELPPGEYRLSAVGVHVARALSDRVFEVGEDGPVTMQAEWRNGVFCYALTVHGEDGAHVPSALLEFPVDGRSGNVLAKFDEQGRCSCWLPARLTMLTIRAAGYLPYRTPLTPKPGKDLYEVTAVLERMPR